eukprot:Pgem_evm1s11711
MVSLVFNFFTLVLFPTILSLTSSSTKAGILTPNVSEAEPEPAAAQTYYSFCSIVSKPLRSDLCISMDESGYVSLQPKRSHQLFQAQKFTRQLSEDSSGYIYESILNNNNNQCLTIDLSPTARSYTLTRSVCSNTFWAQIINIYNGSALQFPSYNWCIENSADSINIVTCAPAYLKTDKFNWDVISSNA